MAWPEPICKNPDYFSPGTGFLHFTDVYVQARTLFSQPHSKCSSFRQTYTEAPLLSPEGKEMGQEALLGAMDLLLSGLSAGSQGSSVPAPVVTTGTTSLHCWPACCMALEGSTIREMLTERRESEDHSTMKSSSISSRPRGGYSPDTSPLPTPHHASSLFSFHGGCEDSLVNVCEALYRWRELCKC